MPAPSRISFVIVIIGVLFVIGLHALGWLAPLEEKLRSSLWPVSRLAYSLDAGADRVRDGREEKYQTLAVEEARQKLLEEENQELRAQLDFLQARSYRSIGADVIGKSTDPNRQTRWINRGALDGVALDQPVVAHAGILVGKIIQVEEPAAVVQLLTDHQSRVAATVANRDQSLGIIEGGYGISMRMNLIPQNETVTVGEAVVTSGLESRIPRGLVIGTIEAVEKEAYQPFQRASITPLVKGEKIRVVSVILGVSSTAPSL